MFRKKDPAVLKHLGKLQKSTRLQPQQGFFTIKELRVLGLGANGLISSLQVDWEADSMENLEVHAKPYQIYMINFFPK